MSVLWGAVLRRARGAGSAARALAATLAATVAVIALAAGPLAPRASAAPPTSTAAFVDSTGTVYMYSPVSAPVAISQAGFTKPNASVASIRIPNGFFVFVVDALGTLDIIASDSTAARISPVGAAPPGAPIAVAQTTGTVDRIVVTVISGANFLTPYTLVTQDVNAPGHQHTPPPGPPPPPNAWTPLPGTPVPSYQGTPITGVGGPADNFEVFSYGSDGTLYGLRQTIGAKGVDTALLTGAVSKGSSMSATLNYAASTAKNAISLFFVASTGSVELTHPMADGTTSAPVAAPFDQRYQTTATGSLAASTDGVKANVAYSTGNGTVADLSLDTAGQWQSATSVTGPGAAFPGASVAAAQVQGEIDLYCASAVTKQPAHIGVAPSSEGLLSSGPPTVSDSTTFTAG